MSEFCRILAKAVSKNNLESHEAQSALECIIDGSATPIQAGSLLTALRMKGETTEEICAFLEVMKKHGVKVDAEGEHLVDTAGTGGDGKHTFNISTAAALVASGAGARLAKHGNRAASSRSGSADVLEALGVNIQIGKEENELQLREIGFTFLFAPLFHPAMKNIGPVRKDLGFKTLFNVMGPLLNPANAKRQLIGVYDREILEKMVEAAKRMGMEKVVFASSDIDEISISSPTLIVEVEKEREKRYEINPEDFGFRKRGLEELRVDDSKESAQRIIEVLEGEHGASRDVVLLNAAAAIYASGLSPSIKHGISMAEESIDKRKAIKKLKELKEWKKAQT